MNYRSVMAVGRTRPVDDPDEKEAALRALVEHIVLALPLVEASAKVRTGPPIDEDPDHALRFWAGVLPLALTPGRPEPDPRLGRSVPLPPHVASWSRRTR
jgi:hypothetical protein